MLGLGPGLGLELVLGERRAWGWVGLWRGCQRNKGLQVSGNEVSRRQHRQMPIVQKDVPGTKLFDWSSVGLFLEGEGGVEVCWPCPAGEGEVCGRHRHLSGLTDQGSDGFINGGHREFLTYPAVKSVCEASLGRLLGTWHSFSHCFGCMWPVICVFSHVVKPSRKRSIYWRVKKLIITSRLG